MSFFEKVVARVSDNPVLFIFFRSLLESDFAAIRALIRRELRLGEKLSCLDLACGPGAFADLFEGDDYVGVDLNARYVDHARKTRKGSFIVGDARKVELPDARFDQILIFGLLHHLADDDARAVLAESKRMLKPDGHVLVIEDIPTLSRLNLIGHLLHSIENGHHIRPAEQYKKLYGGTMRVTREEILRSGICDYYAAVLAP